MGLEGLDEYNSLINILLIFVPFGILASVLHLDELLIFSSCFVGMIPLSTQHSKGTEDIAEKTNEVLGTFCNVTLGDAVEVILWISALRAGRPALIRSALIGSILSNLLSGEFLRISFTLFFVPRVQCDFLCGCRTYCLKCCVSDFARC